MIYYPENDGIDHINVYSKGETIIGQLLSNFALTPFKIEDKWFASVEAYWYYIQSDSHARNELLTKSGYTAKKLGRKLRNKVIPDEAFQARVKRAISAKFSFNPIIGELLRQTDLPLDHYYNYKGKIVRPDTNRWVIWYLEEIREWV